MKAIFLGSIFCFLALGACSKKSSPEATPAVAKVIPQSTMELKVGTEMQPLANQILLPEGSEQGAVITFVGKSDRDGRIHLFYGNGMAINCELTNLPVQLSFNSSSSQNIQLTLPTTIEVKAGEEYSIKFELGVNACMQLQMDLMANWVGVNPSPKPDPTPTNPPTPPSSRPTPAQEPGFLSEEALSQYGGNIALRTIPAGSVYKDYYFEVTKNKRVYNSVNMGSSNCHASPLNAKLELLTIAPDGKVVSRESLDLGPSVSVAPGKFYRLRYTLSQMSACSSVSESFNVGWL